MKRLVVLALLALLALTAACSGKSTEQLAPGAAAEAAIVTVYSTPL